MNNKMDSGLLRKPIRLSPMKYQELGCFFLTSCAYDHEQLFGKIQEGFLNLNPVGRMVTKWWEKLPGKFKRIDLGDFIVMPNHFHGIIRIERQQYQSDYLTINQNGQLVNQMDSSAYSRREDPLVLPYETASYGIMEVDPWVDPSIPRIMQWFKTMSTNEFYRMQKSSGIGNNPKLWQRSYWDHIIRTDADYNRITDYIKKNPKRWIADRFHR